MFFFSDIKQLQESWLYPDVNFSPVRHEDREEALSQESPTVEAATPNVQDVSSHLSCFCFRCQPLSSLKSKNSNSRNRGCASD